MITEFTGLCVYTPVGWNLFEIQFDDVPCSPLPRNLSLSLPSARFWNVKNFNVHLYVRGIVGDRWQRPHEYLSYGRIYIYTHTKNDSLDAPYRAVWPGLKNFLVFSYSNKRDEVRLERAISLHLLITFHTAVPFFSNLLQFHRRWKFQFIDRSSKFSSREPRLDFRERIYEMGVYRFRAVRD